jgi:hypothetical protein
VNESAAVTINLSKPVSSRHGVNTVEKLRASFDESISMLRRGPSTEPIVTKINFVPTLGEIPISLGQLHPILQTLLKLVWETHKKRFHAITSTFKAALEEKLQNTQRILHQKANLKKSNDKLLEMFSEEANAMAISNFEQRWALELEAAREKFQASPSTTIEELLSQALEFCSRIQVEPAQVDVGDLLDQSDSKFRAKCERLWETWKLHVDRHAQVFKGNLSKLGEIDAQIKDLEQEETFKAVAVQESLMEMDGPTSETEAAYKAWMEFVKLLSVLKIDYDIRINIAKKACSWISTRIRESMHSELAGACVALLESEQASILGNREKVRRVLEEVKESQATIETELARACNKSSSLYASALSQMQLTCDLCLEATRETLYQHANNAISSVGVSL